MIETIKSEVSQRDWAQRERTTLRRTKLEALLDKMHECEVYLDRRRQSAIEGKVTTPERDPADELRALADMFPDELPTGTRDQELHLVVPRVLAGTNPLHQALERWERALKGVAPNGAARALSM